MPSAPLPFHRCIHVILVLVLAGLAWVSPLSAQNARKVLIIGVDGTRPDALQAANTPNFDALISNGAVSWLAQTGDITSSGPGWSSLLTGVWRAKHGVNDNSFTGSNFGQYPHFFTRVKQACANAYCASIVNWSPINTQIPHNSDYHVAGISDTQVAQEAVQLLGNSDPDVVFLHFDNVDGAGHSFGYSSTVPQYIAAIESVDTHVGTVLAALTSRPNYATEDWLILSSTDHGGLGTSHGGNTPDERTIFYLVSGAATISGTISPPPNITDIAVTALDFLMPIDPAWGLDGVSAGLDPLLPVTSVFPCVACPSNLVGRADHLNKTVTLNWNLGPGTPPGAYEIYRNGTLVTAIAATSTTYTDTLPAGFSSGHTLVKYGVLALQGTLGTCATIETDVVVSMADVRFADDFEDHATDTDLTNAGWGLVDENNPVETSTWTITNPLGRATPPRFDGKPSNGNFVISDSDFGGLAAPNPTGSGMSHDLWSPTFDCTGLSRVWLHASCSAVLNDNGKAVLMVDVTLDNGLTWNTMYTRVAPSRNTFPPLADATNTDGVHGRLDVELSSFAAFNPAVRFRIRHFEPSWDWWVAIDDVIVDDFDPDQGGLITVLGPEDFSNGIPATWTIQGLNTGIDTWNTLDPCSRSLAASGGGLPFQNGRGVNRLDANFAVQDSDCNPDPAEDEYLVTPAMDCTTFSKVFLGFKSEYLPYYSTTAQVLLSLNGGQTFEPDPIFSYTTGALIANNEEPVYGEHVFEIPAAAGQGNVAFAFRFESPGNQWWWALDDITVSSDGAVPGNGQAPRANLGVLDVNNASEVNGLPLSSGFNGPYFTSIAQGVDDFVLSFEGVPNQPIVLLAGPLGVGAANFGPGIGQMDIGISTGPTTLPTGFIIIMDGTAPGFMNQFFNTGALGTRTISMGPLAAAPGVLTTLQAAIYTGGPTVVALSNAVEITMY